MSKRSLTGSYTAPLQFLEPEKEEDAPSQLHIASKNDYKDQKYNRVINVDLILSYKERMADVARARDKKESTQKLVEESKVEPEPKRRKEEPKQVKFVASSDKELVSLKAAEETETSGFEVKSGEKENNSNGSENGENAPSLDSTAVAVDKLVLPSYNGVELTDQVLDRILPAGFVKAPTPKEFISKDVKEENYYIVPLKVSTAQTVNDALPEYEGILMRKEDIKYFSSLVNLTLDDIEDPEDRKKYRTMDLVFKIKNGTPAIRKKAMRSINSNAKDLGANILFAVILPLMLEPSLDLADRYIVTKLLGRLVYQLQDTIKPFTHQIITALAPALIDEDITIRLETKDVISNISRTAGFANMVSSLRPDLDHADEYVRNLTARVFAIVASAIGLVKVLPFVKAVIRSKKSWQARHTGIRIVHHICILLGGGNGALILPFLSQILEVLQPGLSDELVQVRTVTANTIALLGESVQPYGAEAFEMILEPVWHGLKNHRGRSLAAFLRCLGSIIPLMAHNTEYIEYSNYYTRELMHVMTREFSSPDDDMKKSILRVLGTMPLSKSLFPNYKRQIFSVFFQNFWTRRIALDSSQISRLVVDTSAQMAQKLDIPAFFDKLTPFAKDPNEGLRKMACDAINKILTLVPESVMEINSELETRLVDSVLFAFQEQKQPHPVYLLAFGTVCKVLGIRLKPHITLILSTMLYRIKSSEAEVRQQAADLIATIADTIHLCSRDDDSLMRKLILFLYELLGEVYPEVLGSIIGALHGCLNALDRDVFLSLENPSVNILLPTLTPILKNRQEKVQEQCIKLVGLIAKRNAETINAKEWMRVCFDLLDMLKSQRRRIRVAANATFGDIARTIGPQDVLLMLLNNLQMQERQLRVCTAVAIGIVADTCSPFTVLPALMNEYRYPDKNVQNGVLKAMSFLFEYLDGATSKDYLFAIAPLLEDALTDRDQVHRQIAATVVRNLALNCYGQAHDDYHDVFIHFLNLVLPNIFETSPHVIIRIIECLDSLRIVLGPGVFMNYIWTGLFQAARKVRTPYWKVYNSAYVQGADSLVPCYPRLESVPGPSSDRYKILELDVWL